MKYSFSLCVAVILSLMFEVSSATTITVRDSVYADSIYLYPFGADKVLDPMNVFGPPDSIYAHLGPLGLGPLLDLMFTASDGVNALSIDDSATIMIWGKKDITVDSSAAQVKFIKIDPDGVILYESQQYIIEDGLNTITIPNKGYTFLEFTLTGTEFKPGSQGYLLDAVLLLQNRDSTVASVKRVFPQNASGIRSGYPNPFIASSQQTTVVFRMEHAGDAAVKIFDALGREINAISLGMLDVGDHLVPVSAPKPQVYFARLYLNGIPTGSVYRLIAQ
jgi:hypothetical protein